MSRRAGVSSGYFEQYYWQTVAAAAAAAIETWRRVVTHVGVALVRQESVAKVEGHDEPGGEVRRDCAESTRDECESSQPAAPPMAIPAGPPANCSCCKLRSALSLPVTER